MPRRRSTVSTAPRYLPHYTVADHAAWEGDWELVDGVAVAMTPSPFGRHAERLSRLANSFWNAIDATGCLRPCSPRSIGLSPATRRCIRISSSCVARRPSGPGPTVPSNSRRLVSWAAPQAVHESLISRDMVVEVPLTGLSLGLPWCY